MTQIFTMYPSNCNSWHSHKYLKKVFDFVLLILIQITSIPLAVSEHSVGVNRTTFGDKYILFEINSLG